MGEGTGVPIQSPFRGNTHEPRQLWSQCFNEGGVFSKKAKIFYVLFLSLSLSLCYVSTAVYFLGLHGKIVLVRTIISYLRFRVVGRNLSGIYQSTGPYWGQPGDIYLFCVASRKAYGFTAYIVQNQRSSLMFVKAKVAPMQDQTLPLLELMAVYLVLKCIPTILDNCGGFVATNWSPRWCSGFYPNPCLAEISSLRTDLRTYCRLTLDWNLDRFETSL